MSIILLANGNEMWRREYAWDVPSKPQNSFVVWIFLPPRVHLTLLKTGVQKVTKLFLLFLYN